MWTMVISCNIRHTYSLESSLHCCIGIQKLLSAQLLNFGFTKILILQLIFQFDYNKLRIYHTFNGFLRENLFLLMVSKYPKISCYMRAPGFAMLKIKKLYLTKHIKQNNSLYTVQETMLRTLVCR